MTIGKLISVYPKICDCSNPLNLLSLGNLFSHKQSHHRALECYKKIFTQNPDLLREKNKSLEVLVKYHEAKVYSSLGNIYLMYLTLKQARGLIKKSTAPVDINLILKIKKLHKVFNQEFIS